MVTRATPAARDTSAASSPRRPRPLPRGAPAAAAPRGCGAHTTLAADQVATLNTCTDGAVGAEEEARGGVYARDTLSGTTLNAASVVTTFSPATCSTNSGGKGGGGRGEEEGVPRHALRSLGPSSSTVISTLSTASEAPSARRSTTPYAVDGAGGACGCAGCSVPRSHSASRSVVTCTAHGSVYSSESLGSVTRSASTRAEASRSPGGSCSSDDSSSQRSSRSVSSSDGGEPIRRSLSRVNESLRKRRSVGSSRRRAASCAASRSPSRSVSRKPSRRSRQSEAAMLEPASLETRLALQRATRVAHWDREAHVSLLSCGTEPGRSPSYVRTQQAPHTTSHSTVSLRKQNVSSIWRSPLSSQTPQLSPPASFRRHRRGGLLRFRIWRGSQQVSQALSSRSRVAGRTQRRRTCRRRHVALTARTPLRSCWRCAASESGLPRLFQKNCCRGGELRTKKRKDFAPTPDQGHRSWDTVAKQRGCQ